MISGWHKFDLLICKACKDLPATDFSYMLDLCWESLSGNGLSSDDLTCLVHLSALLLHHAPQGRCIVKISLGCSPFPLGTLKVIQEFTTHSLNLFASYPMFYSGPLSLRLEVFDFIAHHCSDRVSSDHSTSLPFLTISSPRH
jgi:hypothetical protein